MERRKADPSVLVAVDTGKTKAGLAVFVDDTLRLARTVHVRRPEEMAEALIVIAFHVVIAPLGPCGRTTVRWICETPQSYDGKPGLEADLIPMRTLVADLRARSGRGVLTTVKPAEWKGQVPKEVCHRRMSALLSVGERYLLPPATEHDAYDAVCIGLWKLGRCGRGVVTPTGGV